MTQRFFNRLLFLISLLCLLIILQINFFHIPLNWFNFNDDNIEKTNTIIFNLATNIIAGYIFYIINIQIISQIRQNKSKKLIENYLIDIATQMKVGQLYLQHNYFNNKDFNALKFKDFEAFTTLSNTQTNFRYRQVNTLGNEGNCSMSSFTEIDIFEQEASLVKNNIQIVFSFPFISTVDYELISLLHKINTCFFYIGVSQIRDGVTYLNFNKHIFEHYENFKELEKYVKPRLTRI